MKKDKNKEALFDAMEKLKIDSSLIENHTKTGKILHFDLQETDSDLMSLLKNTINELNIPYQRLYDTHGRKMGTNMINGIKNGQLSWERFTMWMEVANLDINIELIPK